MAVTMALATESSPLQVALKDARERGFPLCPVLPLRGALAR
jgi:hypothetical protein